MYYSVRAFQGQHYLVWFYTEALFVLVDLHVVEANQVIDFVAQSQGN